MSVALLWPAPRAQAQDRSDEVIQLVAQAMGHIIEDRLLLAKGQLDEALALSGEQGLPPLVQTFPRIAQALMAYWERDWDALELYATEFEDQMNAYGAGDLAYRVQATIFRAIAMYETGRVAEALPILRQSVAESEALTDDEESEELGRLYLALAATRAAAPDAAALRATFLETYQGAGYVSPEDTQLVRYPALALGIDVPGTDPDRKLTDDEVMDIADAGLDLAEIGNFDAAYRLLAFSNDATYADDYPLLVDHYPNLAFARYHYMRENWDELQRFASSVASALDRDEGVNHPYRIEATIFQGIALFQKNRPGEAEILLRGAMADSAGDPELADLNELAHYYLARAATDVSATDASALRESFMQGFTGEYLVTNSQALFLLYLSLNAALREGEPPEELITQSEQIIGLADELDGIEPIYRSYFRGNHGQLLYKAGRYAEARTFFEERRDFLIGNDNISSDYAVNALRLGNAVARTDGIATARTQMIEDLAKLREAGRADDWAFADLMGQIGFTYRWVEDEATAQDYFRQAYAELRKTRRVTDSKVKFYADLIDADDPGLQGFALAAELGAIDRSSYELKSGGEDTIRMFLEGNYAGLERLLAAYAERGEDRSPEYLLNLALYKAMIGAYDESQTALDEARRKARTSLGSSIPANAAIFDLTDLVSKVWGTVHLADKVDDAIARLQAREGSLPRPQLSLYLTFRALAKYQSGAEAGVRTDLRRWMEVQPDPRTEPPTVLEQWTYALTCEMIYSYFGPEEGDEWMAKMLGWLDMADSSLSLVRDTMHLTRSFSSPTYYTSDLAISEMSGLATSILDEVPRDHALGAAVQFNVANAFWSRNMYDDALKWMQRATDSWRSNPYHRKDTLAFLITRQANLMLFAGKTDVAATLAREAFDMIDPMTARGDLAAGIVMAYAAAVRQRHESPERGGAVMKEFVENEAFMARLPVRDQIYMHQTYADMLANYAPIEEVLAQIDQAEAKVPDDGLDWRPDRSQVVMTRAIAVYWAKRYSEAWHDITRSNDIKADWRSDAIRDGDGEDVNASETRNRAAWEAIIGWDYAATLPPEPPG